MIRTLALIVPAALALAPAATRAAEPVHPADTAEAADMAQVAAAMRNPAAQAAMGDAMAAMMGAMLDMPAAPFLKAANTMSDGKAPKRAVRRDATLRDLAGADAADAPRQMARAVPVMMGGMAGMTEAMGAMLPQLREMGARMGKAIAEALPDAAGSAGEAHNPDVRPAYPGDAVRKATPTGSARSD